MTGVKRACLLALSLLITTDFGCAGPQSVPEIPHSKYERKPNESGLQTKVETTSLKRLLIPRYALLEVQSQGPGRILQRVPIRPFRQGGQFLGFQIVQLFPGEGIAVRGVQVGDVILRINGRRMDRPEQFMKLFQGMDQWTEVIFELLRNGEELSVRYSVEQSLP